MAYNDLTCKLEAALKSVVDGLALSGVTVNTGVEDDELAVPYVICSAQGGEEIIFRSGVSECTARVTVASSADDTTLADHRTRKAAIFDAFRASNIASVLSAAVPDFTALQVRKTAEPEAIENRQLKSSMEFEIMCCPSDIT